MRQILRVGSLRDFERFIRILAARPAAMLNRSDVARDVGVAVKTIGEWLSVLETSGQIALIEPWYANFGKRLVKTPKVYFRDTGLLCFLLNLNETTLLPRRCSARSGRGSVFAEMRKLNEIGGRPLGLWYYRDLRGREVDFVLESGGSLSFAECKWGRASRLARSAESVAGQRRDGGRRGSLAARRALCAGPPGRRFVADARGCRGRRERPTGDPRWAVAARGVDSSPGAPTAVPDRAGENRRLSHMRGVRSACILSTATPPREEESMIKNTRGLFLAVLLLSVPAEAQLPPAILVDQLLLRVERLIEEQETEEALEVIQEILALREEHGTELPPEFRFRRAQATFAAGTLEPAKESVTSYLMEAGRDGEFYEDALALLEEVERILERRDAPDCAGQPEGTECWMELANQPGCHVWNEGLELGARAEWTGACASGFATGTGTLTWEWPPDNRQEMKGTYRFGRKHGFSVEEFEDGDVGEGPYVNGKRNGHWVWTYGDGGKAEGPNVDGKRNGHWVQEYANGNVGEGPYVDDQRSGRWVWRFPDGQGESGPYVDGKQDGHWVIKLPDGSRQEGPFVNGAQTGHWTLTFVDGQIEEGPLVDGQRHGQWMITRPDGAVDKGAFVAGQRQGQWVREHPAPTHRICHIRYVDDEAQDEWDCRNPE